MSNNDLLQETIQMIFTCPHLKEEDVAPICGRSLSSFKALLGNYSLTFQNIKCTARMKIILSDIRTRSDIKESALICGIEFENFYKYFKKHTRVNYSTYIEEVSKLKKNKLTEQEFEALKNHILIILTISTKTCRQLSELTGASIAYVRAALKELSEAFGGSGIGQMHRGYHILPNNEKDAYITIHTNWVSNWHESRWGNSKAV